MPKRVLRADHIAELRESAAQAASSVANKHERRARHEALVRIERAARTLQKRVWTLEGKHGPLPTALDPLFAELAYQIDEARSKRGRPHIGADAATEVLYSGGMGKREIVKTLDELGIESAGDAFDALNRVKTRIKRLRRRWRGQERPEKK